MPDAHEHDRGLAHDLATLRERTAAALPVLGRRRALQLLGAGGLGLLLVACGRSDDPGSGASGGSGGSTSTSGAAATGGTAADGSAIPEETAGPYPGDGSNGPNVLDQDGIVRSDLRTSFGSLSGTAQGIETAVDLTVVDAATGDPLPGAALYLWHCTREGGYSLYSPGLTDQNYLRGVQAAGDDGLVRFTTIFPAAYDGRWPHMHFEVYPDLATATAGGQRLVTSQLALPEDVCQDVYATPGYEASVANLARTSLATDMVFADGSSMQVPAVTGSVADGYRLALTVPVRAA